MIVYSDREEIVSTREFQRRIDLASDPTERLILEGQFESGVMDALCPEIDDVVEHHLPDSIRVRVPEGFAFYALYPEMYACGARRFMHEQRPSSCVVVGIRSIGTTLSRVVADAVSASWRFTVRPHGHPFDRELRAGTMLEARIRERVDDWFLVVDEGPGLSGSSFISVAMKLEELGVKRIALFPSHDPDPSVFRSEQARRNWVRFARYVEPFRADRFVPADASDLSGGLWRDVVNVDCAVEPSHERRKYRHQDRLWKFEGLGHFGKAKLERARALKGFVPAPIDLQNGFLISDWVDARPAELSEELLDAMANYLAFLRAEFITSMKPANLSRMIEVNTGIKTQAPEDGVVVAVDGRMLPQEWLQTGAGYVKTDALDHHDDHFYPGCQDIAWDIAGAAVEWGLPVDALTDRYLRLQSDATLRSRLPFYELAYRAYRYGYCEMFGFHDLASRYRKW